MRQRAIDICVLLLVITAGTVVFADDWPSWSGVDTSRTRCSEEPILVNNPITLDWSQALGSQIISSPAVANGRVFVGTETGRMFALREDTGAIAWEFAAQNAISASPCVDRDRVYFVSCDGHLYALRASTGALLWTFELGGSPTSSPVVVGNLLFVGTSFPDARIMAVNVSSESPQMAWSLPVPEVVYSSPAVVDGNLYIGSNDGRLYALNTATVTSVWAQPYQTIGIVNYSSPLYYNNYLFFCPGGIDTRLHRINVADGSPAAPTVNVRPNGGQKLVVSSPARTGNTVFVLVGNLGLPSQALEMWAINATDMTTVWGPVNHGNTEDRAIPAATPACTNPPAHYGVPASVFVVTQASRQFVARRADNGVLLGSATLDSAAYSSPAIANARIFVASSNGTVYAFRGQNRPPTPPTVLAPANEVNVFSAMPTITWSAAADPDDDAISFVLRYDTDGEVLDSWQAEIELPAGIPPGSGAYTFTTPVSDNTRISYAIRARDTRRAFSVWTATQHFWVRTSPMPPTNFQAHIYGGEAALSWSASPSSDVAGYELAYAPHGQPLPAYTQIGNVLTWSVSGLTHGVVYVFSLRAYDFQNQSSTAIETQTAGEGTPPVAGTVRDGALGEDLDWQPSTTAISANWLGFDDPESGIQDYEWAIGMTPGGTELQGFLNVGNLTSATNNTLTLWHGQTYYVTVRARNNAGLTTTVTSDGVTVDVMGPSPTSIVIAGGAVYSGTTMVSLSLVASDGGSGVSEMRLMSDLNLNGIPDDEWEDWQPFETAFPWTLAPPGGGSRRVFTQFQDAVGNLSDIVFDDIWLDTSLPLAGTVNDGTGEDIDWQVSTTTISANWSGFMDAESGITNYEWAIGTSAGEVNVQGFVSVGLATSATAGGLSLDSGQVYYVTVRAINGAGLMTNLSSDGVTITTVTPLAGTVNDGTGADIDWQTSTTTISANWSGFSDAEGGIAGYAWAIGTTPGATDVQEFVNVGLNTVAMAGGLSLVHGQTYYVSVRATNRVGMQTTATSDGVTIDAIGLQSLSVTPGNAYVGFRWQPRLSPDIVGYRLYQRRQGGIWELTVELGNVTSYILPRLVNGTTYDFLIRAVNSLGYETTGIQVSATPAENLGITPSVSGGYSPLTVSFTGNAGWSNVLQYSWDFDGNGTSDWLSWTTGDIMHVYSVPGSYAARLTMYLVGETVVTAQTTITVNISPDGPPAAGWASETNGQAPLTVNFSVGAAQQIEVYTWDIGANGVVEFVKNNPSVGLPGDWVWQYTFTESGNYTVKLRTVDILGASNVWTTTIVVAPAGVPSPQILTLGLADGNELQPWYPGTWVHFTATGGDTVDFYEWDFDGDGSYDVRYAAEIDSNGNPLPNQARWFYTAAGNYTVTLRVVDEGDPDTPTDNLSTTQALDVPVQIEPTLNVRVWFVWPEDGYTISGNSVIINVNAVPAFAVDFSTMVVEHRPAGGAWQDAGVTLVQSAPPAMRFEWNTAEAVVDGDYELRAAVYATNGSGPYEAIINVTVDNYPPPDPDPDTNENEGSDGVRRNRGKVHANRRGRLQTGNPTIMEYYLGTFVANNHFTVTFLNQNPTTSVPFGQTFIPAFRRFELTEPVEVLLPPLVTISYPDENDDGVVDGTTIAETTLRIYRYDVEESRWEILPDQVVDARQNYVVGWTPGFTPFGVAGQATISAGGGGGGGDGGGGGGGICFVRRYLANISAIVLCFSFVVLCIFSIWARSRRKLIVDRNRSMSRKK